ncbi:MAG: hypothetical protein ACTSWA_03475 [Candidatus Thorarchaeota archaeon]
MVDNTDETTGVKRRMVPAYYLYLCIIGFAILIVGAYFIGTMSAPATEGFGSDSLIIVAASTGGIVVGLLLGVLVGRRR